MPSSTLSLALLLAVLLVASVAASSTCVTRVQCSNHGNCVNGSCQCDTGFAGTTCQYCVAAGVCGHGQVRGGQPSPKAPYNTSHLVLHDNKTVCEWSVSMQYWVLAPHTHTRLQPYLTPTHTVGPAPTAPCRPAHSIASTAAKPTLSATTASTAWALGKAPPVPHTTPAPPPRASTSHCLPHSQPRHACMSLQRPAPAPTRLSLAGAGLASPMTLPNYSTLKSLRWRSILQALPTIG